jgi:hypothetical protein
MKEYAETFYEWMDRTVNDALLKADKKVAAAEKTAEIKVAAAEKTAEIKVAAAEKKYEHAMENEKARTALFLTNKGIPRGEILAFLDIPDAKLKSFEEKWK